jgi:hypothetical protein
MFLCSKGAFSLRTSMRVDAAESNTLVVNTGIHTTHVYERRRAYMHVRRRTYFTGVDAFRRAQ